MHPISKNRKKIYILSGKCMTGRETDDQPKTSQAILIQRTS